VHGAYLKDLLDQPEALWKTCEGLADIPSISQLAGRLAQGRFRRVVLTGMGSSFHALHPLHLQLNGRGITSLMVETSELVHYMHGLLEPETLLVAVSQSGESVETVRLLDAAGGRPYVIGVTNQERSRLAEAANATVLMHAGAESGVACKTYVATLLSLDWLGALLCGKDLHETRKELQQAAPAANQYLRQWKRHVESLCDLLTGVHHIFITGRGSSLAAAGAGGLITKEAARFPAQAMSSAAFRHGPFEMVSGQVFVLVYSGDPETAELNQKLVADIVEAGGRSALVGSDAQLEVFRLPAVGRSIRPIVEILPAQMMSLALASLGGHEAGKFNLITKVTTVE